MSKNAVLTEYTVNAPRLSRPMTIALAADIHERDADDVLMLIKQAKPDIIAVAGDTFERMSDVENRRTDEERPHLWTVIAANIAFFINFVLKTLFVRKNVAVPENAVRFLSEAVKIAPVYLSLGNHDEILLPEDIEFLDRQGICLLDNSDECFDWHGDKIRIGGLSLNADGEWLERYARSDGYHILLCHKPEYYDDLIAEKPIELVLSGHNHGGQVRMFGRGLVSSAARLLPKYDKGLFDGRMVVSAGCSCPTAIPRINNPREAVIIKLNPT